MAERTERGVSNQLIATCKDAERGFRHAASHVNDTSLKALFTGSRVIEAGAGGTR